MVIHFKNPITEKIDFYIHIQELFILDCKNISLWCIVNIFHPIILCFYLVIVLAVRGESLRKLMIHAHEMGLIQENYIFICVYYYPHKNTFGDISWKQVALVYFSVINRGSTLKCQFLGAITDVSMFSSLFDVSNNHILWFF